MLVNRAWVCVPHGDLEYLKRHPALFLPRITKMASNSKPKKHGLRSRLRHLLSSKPTSGRDEPIAQDLQVLEPPCLPDNSNALTPPSVEDSQMPVVRAGNITSPMEPSTSTSMFSGAQNFGIGGVYINSPHIYNGQDKPGDGMSVQC